MCSKEKSMIFMLLQNLVGTFKASMDSLFIKNKGDSILKKKPLILEYLDKE